MSINARQGLSKTFVYDVVVDEEEEQDEEEDEDEDNDKEVMVDVIVQPPMFSYACKSVSTVYESSRAS